MTKEEKKDWMNRCRDNEKKRLKKNPELKIIKARKNKEWRNANKEKIVKSQKKWRANNPGYSYKQHKKRATKDPAYRALHNQRTAFRKRMKLVKKGGSNSFSQTLGCSTKEFRHHMESQFDKHMSWDNYGSYWHVDHILPCASFDHTEPEQVKKCWHWSNLQPMEAAENIAKSDQIVETQPQLLLDYV